MLDVPREIRLVIKLLLCETISKETERIRTAVFDVEIFSSDFLNQPFVQHCAASEKRGNPAVDFAILVPAPEQKQVISIFNPANDWSHFEYVDTYVHPDVQTKVL